MTIEEAEKHIALQLKPIWGEGEAIAMANLVMESITGKKKPARSTAQKSILTIDKAEQINEIISRLLKHEPVQYILQEAWFGGLKFYVDKNVLIPRPETEELVEWIISGCRFPVDELKILDIGSGSGCIPIALKRRLKKAEVWGCDNSAGALRIARQNAAALGTDVNFLQLDFLEPDAWDALPSFDIIVSNPPYIPGKDKGTIPPNVLLYEPSSALFVPGEDPLLFYKAIVGFGKTHLNPGGKIYCEIHEEQGEATSRLFRSFGFSATLKKDMQQKDRMIQSGLA